MLVTILKYEGNQRGKKSPPTYPPTPNGPQKEIFPQITPIILSNILTFCPITYSVFDFLKT